MDEIRTRVLDILRNHERESRAVTAQIAAEKEALERDLEDILTSGAYPSSAINPTGVRSSSPDPGANMTRIVERRDLRRAKSKEVIAGLERQLAQIGEVREMVMELDTRSKCVLMALYFPYRTYDEAAEFLSVDRATVYRQRKTALSKLFSRAERSKLFTET